MKTILISLSIILLLSYVQNNGNKIQEAPQYREQITEPDFETALKFINDYAEYCNKRFPRPIDQSWIENNSLLTEQFKTEYKKIVNSGNKADPEMGLGFDPIFNAQDYPEKGFEVLITDTKKGLVTVNGIDMAEFEVSLILKFEQNKWLVDGCGIVSML